MWIPSVDTPDAKIVGNGNPISKFENKYYLCEDATITNWSPESDTATWKRIVGVIDFKASAPPSVIKFYDGFDELGSKKGRKESTFTISMEDRGDLQTVKKYDGQQLWYLKAVQDDRGLVATDGTNKYHMLKAYYAKLDSFDYSDNDINEISAEGSFNTATAKTLYAEITPVTVTIDGTDNAATASTPEIYTVSGVDFNGTTVDLTDLSAEILAGEIVSIGIEKVSGTPTITTTTSTNDNDVSVTYVGTGSVVVRAKIVTKSASTFYSGNKTVTVSA